MYLGRVNLTIEPVRNSLLLCNKVHPVTEVKTLSGDYNLSSALQDRSPSSTLPLAADNVAGDVDFGIDEDTLLCVLLHCVVSFNCRTFPGDDLGTDGRNLFYCHCL